MKKGALSHEIAAPPPLSAEDSALLYGYLNTLQMFPGNTPRLFAIGFLGLPGSGKSTCADYLGELLQLPVNRSDQIRRYLNTRGFPGHSPRQDIMAAMAEERTRHFYEHNTSAIIDANFTEYAANSRATAASYNASLLLVRVICPDEIAIERLQARSKHAGGRDSATTAEHFARIRSLVATYTPVDDVYFEVNSTLPLDPQAQELHTKLLTDGFIAQAG